MGIVATYHQITREEAEMLARDADFSKLLFCCGDANRLHCDIEKEWSALHFLLTGSASPCIEEPSDIPVIEEPLSAAIYGRRVQLGEGYFTGLTSPEKVSEIAHALQAFDIDARLDQMASSAFADNDIFPDIWECEDERADETQFLRECFVSLRKFYLDVEAAGSAVLVTFF